MTFWTSILKKKASVVQGMNGLTFDEKERNLSLGMKKTKFK